MHLPLRPALLVLSAALVSIATAQSSSTRTSNTTTTPGATAPNAVVQPPRPAAPTTANTPQPPSTAVNPLAPNLPPAGSAAAQTNVNSPTAVPGATTGTALAVEPSNINALAAAGIDVALNPTAALAALRQAPVTHQQTAVSSLQTRVDATNRALLDLRAQARASGIAGAGPKFDQAAEDVRVREMALRDALSSAAGTTDEAAWRQAQTQLATLYQAYADSVQRARALLQAPPQL